MTEHAFDGLLNFRDLGGLPARDGGRIRPGRVFRSDAFDDASPADIRHISDDLGIGAVVDLRALRELGEKPHPLLVHGVVWLHCPIDSGPGTAIESAPAGERLSFRYAEYLDHSAASIVTTLRHLASRDAPPTVIHCKAGKDRTAVTVAILLSLLGVPDHEIVADYAITATNMPRILERLKLSPTYSENVSRLPAEMYSAEAITMESFLAHIAQRHGSAEKWASEQGFQEDSVHALYVNLVESQV